MNIKSARDLLCMPIDGMTLEQLQRHKVRLIDAWRESKAAYGFIRAVSDGFYKIVESDSASGFVPSDPWLTHNLSCRMDEIDKELDSSYAAKETHYEHG
ncbi:MAG: hypothetical protein IJP78_07995 [Clostridia bacterium]|nr:hypothetical protein [Clostridia bacterium]